MLPSRHMLPPEHGEWLSARWAGDALLLVSDVWQCRIEPSSSISSRDMQWLERQKALDVGAQNPSCGKVSTVHSWRRVAHIRIGLFSHRGAKPLDFLLESASVGKSGGSR